MSVRTSRRRTPTGGSPKGGIFFGAVFSVGLVVGLVLLIRGSIKYSDLTNPYRFEYPEHLTTDDLRVTYEQFDPNLIYLTACDTRGWNSEPDERHLYGQLIYDSRVTPPNGSPTRGRPPPKPPPKALPKPPPTPRLDSPTPRARGVFLFVEDTRKNLLRGAQDFLSGD